MPKRKAIDDSVTQPSAAAEVKKPRSRSAASKPNTPAATHKRASKKAVIESTATAAVQEVTMPKSVRIPTHDEIARLAYSYWESRGRQHGYAEEDWTRAERTLSELA
jgi:hypothetical protein